MKDIADKIETLRTAVAQAHVAAKKATIERAVCGDTPKGEVLPIARAAAVLAAKKTAELIPYCHPLALDAVAVDFEHGDAGITVLTRVKSIGRTGVEMEALTAAAVAALTIYDMLKGIDTDVVISAIQLVEKHGGKSDFQEKFAVPPRVAVLVTSDSVAQGKKADKSGKIIVEEMRKFPVKVRHCETVADERAVIRQKLLAWTEDGIDVVLTTGGTGLGPRDVTVEAVRDVIERDIPGIAEAMRSYGQKRTPYAMLSREVAGVRGKTLIITLPGSSKGVRESLAAVFPHVLHLFYMMRAHGHA